MKACVNISFRVQATLDVLLDFPHPVTHIFGSVAQTRRIIKGNNDHSYLIIK